MIYNTQGNTMSVSTVFSVTAKKTLITGGASGIGRACALAFAAAGADIAIIDRNKSLAEKTVDEIRELGVKALYLPCNVADEHEVTQAVASIVQHWGCLDIAINSAGIAPDSDTFYQQKSDWEKVLEVNLTGVWLCAQAQAKQMAEQRPMGGKIINIASAAARTANINMAYCASKAGVSHLTRSLAMQLGAKNINVNTISPGVLMSPLIAQTPLAFRDKMRSITPMGYIARPQDVIGAALFLASSAADFITGQDILVDGGRTLTTQDIPDRVVPPRVNREQELQQVKADLDLMGVAYNEDGLIVEE